jgi:hypothetical protein
MSVFEAEYRLPVGAAHGGDGVQQGAVDLLDALLPAGA